MKTRNLVHYVVTLSIASSFVVIASADAQQLDRVTAISAPAIPLADEAGSRNVTKFSFIVYGDTRGRRDGTTIQYEHSLVIDGMLTKIKQLKSTEYPVKFVLQSGDAVLDGSLRSH